MPRKNIEEARAYWREYSKNHRQPQMQRRINLRKKAIDILGGICKKCGTTEKLQLRHRYYANDSIRPFVHNEPGNRSIKRIQEAIKHPERFSLLCLPCHNSIEPRKKKKIPLAIWFDRQEQVK